MNNRHASPWVIAAVVIGRLGAAVAADDAPDVRMRPMSELRALATVRLGDTADWVAITDDAVWSGSSGPFALHRIDPKTNERVASVPLPGEPCAGLAAGFGAVWVPLCTKPASLAKVDAKSNKLTLYKVGPAAEEGGIAVSDESVWLVTDAKGVLARIDPTSGAVTQKIKVPAGSYNPWFADGRIWLTHADGKEVTPIEAATGKVLAGVPTDAMPRFLTSGAGAVWTLNQREGSLTRIDAASSQSRTIPLGMSGHGGDLAFANGMVWITLRRIPLAAVDASSDRMLCQWIGAGGDSLRIGHGSIWLTDYTEGTLTRYDLNDATTRCRMESHGLVGTWKLLRYEDRGPDGAKELPFGEHPVGRLIYGADGTMSIQIMKVPHPKVASGDAEKVTPAEKQALFDAYEAHFGRYRVDDTKHVVVHEVEGDLADVYIGQGQERPYVLEGDTLKLVPVWTRDGKQWEGVREFVRQ
jgi:virginiamycin B lyase